MADEAANPEKCPAKNAGKLWQILQEMEENDEHKRLFSGSLGYRGFIQAIYQGRVQMGFEDENKKTA
ncbi:MAG: hypothetical protein M0Q47_06925 [Methanothrix sp.]|jgi:hypothetical protein|uniref:hypothetical protein n=1 Tax=Methanothrix sp. TaxID=90426 RepID=UPI0025E236FA|nr:hypothetical protein [Methanothrix sp.]MCK9406123.1 hypothetical protein [Methanothrix sp.]MDD5734075.1 hypothetical protein [Methanothrix soehngenii]